MVVGPETAEIPKLEDRENSEEEQREGATGERETGPERRACDDTAAAAARPRASKPAG